MRTISKVKTAISIDKDLFEKVLHLAQDLHISRSQLFSQAVEYLLEKKETLEIVQKLNEVYDDSQSDEDKNILKLAHGHLLHILQDEK